MIVIISGGCHLHEDLKVKSIKEKHMRQEEHMFSAHLSIFHTAVSVLVFLNFPASHHLPCPIWAWQPIKSRKRLALILYHFLPCFDARNSRLMFFPCLNHI